MLKFNKSLLYLAIVCALSSKAMADFPDDPKPCKYGDTKCIEKLITYFLHQKPEGDKSINLLSTDPMLISSMRIKQGEDSPLNIDLKFKNNKLYGFKDAVVEKVRGFDKDMTKKHEIVLKGQRISVAGDYSIIGKVIILPISGTGISNITLLNTKVVLQFAGTPLVKDDGLTYMTVANLKFTITPERVVYNFGNLFNGDKVLGDNMNLFLNENWREIFEEARVSIVNAFSRVFQNILNEVFTHQPYAKFFAE